MKKILKRMISTVTAFAVMLCAAVVFGVPEKITAATTSGTCGDALTWSINGTTLTISGSGAMNNYRQLVGEHTTVPWSCSGITSVVIENGVTSIGNFAFFNFTALTSVSIPESVTSIGIQAFKYCEKLTAIDIPKNVETIGDNAFEACTSLKSVTIPEKVTRLNSAVFANCSALESVIIPNTVTVISMSAFNMCKSLRNVTIPDGVTAINSASFYGCAALESITIPDGVTKIDGSAFGGCSSLTSIIIPDAVKSIGDYAFNNCSGLTGITIPAAVESIGYSAFKNCTNLATASLDGNTPPTLAADVFADTAIVNANGTIYVPCGATDSYTTAARWSEYENFITGKEHSFDIGNWYENEESHWHKCTVCGAKTDEAAHDFSNGACVCGREKPAISIDAEHFPDEKFRAYISGNIDTDKDGRLSSAEITAVTKLVLYESRDGRETGLGITDLTGIEFFTELTELNCDHNEGLSSPDLSKNTKLTSLSLQCCELTELDVSTLTELRWLYCAYNSLRSLDLRNNPKLETLHCPFNQFVSLKLAETAQLEDRYFDFGDNHYDTSSCLLDISELEQYGFELSKASNFTNCSWINDAQLLYLSGSYVQYDYDCGNGRTVRLSIQLRHDVTEVKGNPATCTEDGTITYYHCSKCGYNFKRRPPKTEADIINNIDTDTVEKATGHEWDSWEITANPTLSSKGEAARCCKNDEEHTQTRQLPALSDTGFWQTYLDMYLAEVNKEEMSEEEYGQLYDELCEICHKDPTINDAGMYVYVHINENPDDSDDNLMVESMIPALGDMSVWTKTERIKPTIDSEGEFVYTSADYGTFSVTVPKLNHVHRLTHVDEVPATETAEGVKEHWHCEVCGRNFADENAAKETSADDLRIGRIEKEIQHGENAPKTELATPKDELIEMVLTLEEQKAVKDGKDIKIILKVEDATDDIPAEDKTAVEVKIGELENYKLGQYLNVELLKQIGEENEKITQTNKPVKVTFEIPETMRGEGRYFVIRVHNGETTVLADTDNDDKTITILTDKFSTYALVYKEEASTEPVTDPSQEETSSGDDKPSDNESPASGENSPSADESEEPSGGNVLNEAEKDTASGITSPATGNDNAMSGIAASLISLTVVLAAAMVVFRRRKN